MKLNEIQEDPIWSQFNVLLKDFNRIQELTKIDVTTEKEIENCLSCRTPHYIHQQHNLVQKNYSEAKFIEDLIKEFQTLYLIQEWAQSSIEIPITRETMSNQEKAWHMILSGQYDQVNQYLNNEEKSVLNSLRPFGQEGELFDFMKMSQYQNENWILTLEYLHHLTCNSSDPKYFLYKWATCQPVDWESNINKFNEQLWINIRADLFSKVMTRHAELYPLMKEAINYGINKPFIWKPPHYQLNCGYMNDEIDRFGKKLIIVIIKYLTKKATVREIIELIDQVIENIHEKANEIKYSQLRAKCFYEIGKIIGHLLQKEKQQQFYEQLKISISLIQNEQIDTQSKQNYLIELLLILKENDSQLGFIFSICQNQIMYQGDSLKWFLDRMKGKFEKHFITRVAFENFENLSISQQNELLTQEFSGYFDENELETIIKLNLPYIIENIEHFKDLFVQLAKQFQFQQELNYFQIFQEQNIQQMFNYIILKDIPSYWFIKYILFILKQEINQEQNILKIMDAIQKNLVLFQSLAIYEDILAIITSKLLNINGFTQFLLI